MCCCSQSDAQHSSIAPSHTHTSLASPAASAGSVLRQLAESCESYLPAVAREALLAAARKQPFHGATTVDSEEAVQQEMQRNPLEAAAHEASEL